jgi:hypothetical protein
MPTKTRFLSRKGIAELLECNARQVKRNEARWGLAGARCDLNARVVRYRASEVFKELLDRGLIERD